MLKSDQSFVYYQKGGLSLYAIKEATGEAYMNNALQRMLQKYGPDRYRALPEALLVELCERATAWQQQFIKERLQLVGCMMLAWAYQSCRQQANGSWELEMKLSVKKWDHT